MELQEQEKSAEVGSDLTVAEAGLQSLLLQRKEMLVRSKTELLEFLELSNYYNASELLRSLPDDSFLEEKAVGENRRFDIDHPLQTGRRSGSAGDHRPPLGQSKHGRVVLPARVGLRTESQHFPASHQNVWTRRGCLVDICFLQTTPRCLVRSASNWRFAC